MGIYKIDIAIRNRPEDNIEIIHSRIKTVHDLPTTRLKRCYFRLQREAVQLFEEHRLGKQVSVSEAKGYKDREDRLVFSFRELVNRAPMFDTVASISYNRTLDNFNEVVDLLNTLRMRQSAAVETTHTFDVFNVDRIREDRWRIHEGVEKVRDATGEEVDRFVNSRTYNSHADMVYALRGKLTGEALERPAVEDAVQRRHRPHLFELKYSFILADGEKPRDVRCNGAASRLDRCPAGFLTKAGLSNLRGWDALVALFGLEDVNSIKGSNIKVKVLYTSLTDTEITVFMDVSCYMTPEVFNVLIGDLHYPVMVDHVYSADMSGLVGDFGLAYAKMCVSEDTENPYVNVSEDYFDDGKSVTILNLLPGCKHHNDSTYLPYPRLDNVTAKLPSHHTESSDKVPAIPAEPLEAAVDDKPACTEPSYAAEPAEPAKPTWDSYKPVEPAKPVEPPKPPQARGVLEKAMSVAEPYLGNIRCTQIDTPVQIFYGNDIVITKAGKSVRISETNDFVVVGALLDKILKGVGLK